MTDARALLELAGRCEKATGPDRELDCLIFEAQHRLLIPERRGTYYGEPTGEYFDLDGIQLPERAPHFTASIDAAMTLVPEGWRWQVSDRAPAPHKGRAYLHNDQLHFANHTQPNPKYKHAEVTAATPALALCAAVLRARASLETST